MTDKKVEEQMILNLADPRGEYGKNNLRDIIMQFHESGQSPEQIYNILYTMGVTKETAYDGIQQYLPKKTTIQMDIQEKLDLKTKLQVLIETLSTEDQTNPYVATLRNVCERYLTVDLNEMSIGSQGSTVRQLVSELNIYNYVDAVAECIASIEEVLKEHVIAIQADAVKSQLANSNQSDYYTPVIEKLTTFNNLNESEIRKEVSKMDEIATWVPEVKSLMEQVNVLEPVSEEEAEAKKTINERLDLKNKIKNLAEAIKSYDAEKADFTISSVKSICETYLNMVYTKQTGLPEYLIAEKYINELSSFVWIDVVKESMKELTDFINENIMSFQVDTIQRKMANAQGNKLYAAGLMKLDEMLTLDEAGIREQVKYGMDALTWIPEMRYLVEVLNSIEGNLNDDNAAVISKIYSPVVEYDGGHAFFLSGQAYVLKESEIVLADPNVLGAMFLTLISITENFSFSGGSMTTYKGQAAIEISKGEEGASFKVNGKAIEIKESDDIRNYLLSSGLFKINETAALDIVVKAFENVDKIVELDFVQSINSRVHPGVVANVVRVNEEVYINRINPEMRVNEMVKANNSEHAMSLVREYVDFDISPTITDLLEGDAKVAALHEAKKNDLFDRIGFLKDQREKLSRSDGANEVITSADTILVEEIGKTQKELNELVQD